MASAACALTPRSVSTSSSSMRVSVKGVLFSLMVLKM